MTDIKAAIIKAILESNDPDKAVRICADIIEDIARKYERDKETINK